MKALKGCGKGWSKGLTKETDERVAKRYGLKHSIAVSLAKKGRKLSSETIEKMRRSRSGHLVDKETRRRISIANKKVFEYRRGKTYEQIYGVERAKQIKEKISNSEKGILKPKPHDKAYKEKQSLILKRLWKDPKYIQNQMRARGVRPNKYEEQLRLILGEILPGEYQYVGDGQFIISGKCPDFININGKKKIIELWGDYWHKGENPQNRIDIFKPFGFDTLIIWTNELRDKETLKNKLLIFNGEVTVS